MATTTWTGSSNSDWATAGNWTNGLPATGDTAIVDGSVGITGGTPSGNAEVERVYIASTYTGAIGSSGTPLELDVAQLSVDNTTSGSTHFIHLTGSNNTTPNCVIDGTKTGAALYISGDLASVTVEPTFAGTMYLGNSASKDADIKDLVMLSTSGTIDASNAANVSWVTGATCYQTAGTVTIGEHFGQDSTWIMSGGSLNVTGWTATSGESLKMLGGTCTWTAGSTGTSGTAINALNTLKVMGGTFTTATNEKAYVKFGVIDQSGGSINMQSPFPNITFTTFNSTSGTFTYPKQSALTTSPK